MKDEWKKSKEKMIERKRKSKKYINKRKEMNVLITAHKPSNSRVSQKFCNTLGCVSLQWVYHMTNTVQAVEGTIWQLFTQHITDLSKGLQYFVTY